MIVIEGEKGKSVVLEDLINNTIRNRNMVILDTVGVHGLRVSKEIHHYMLKDMSVEEVIMSFEKEYSEFKNFDWVVFEVNCKIEDYSLDSTFKQLDRKYPQNFVVTVQNSNTEQLEVYFA